MNRALNAFAILLLGLASICFSQQDTTWNRWNWLIGDWIGEGSGTPGRGVGWFSIQPNLGGKILVRRSHSDYPATKEKPQIVHDDFMVVYADSGGQPSKAIYFDNEGHVINYSVTYSERSVVLTSSRIQNASVFRLTYVLLNKETVDVKFEMSHDGEHFLTYTEGKCKKKTQHSG